MMTKLKLHGMNAIFCLQISINISDQIIAGVASGTAVCLRALPIPKPLKVNVKQKQNKKNSEKAEEHIQALQNFASFNIKHILSRKAFTFCSPYSHLKNHKERNSKITEEESSPSVSIKKRETEL